MAVVKLPSFLFPLNRGDPNNRSIANKDIAL